MRQLFALLISLATSHLCETSSAACRKRRAKSATSEPLFLGKTLHVLTEGELTGEAASTDLASVTEEENVTLCDSRCSATAVLTDVPAAIRTYNPSLNKDGQLQRCLADDFRPDCNHHDEILPMSGDQESVEHIEIDATEGDSMQSLKMQDNPSMVTLEQGTGSIDDPQLTLEGWDDLSKMNASNSIHKHNQWISLTSYNYTFSF